MSAFPQRIYVANAGSGKTFQLAHAYLSLLFAGVEPREILATTFTRKAAGEILGRVMTTLLEAAESDEKRERMLGHLDPKPPSPPSAETCAELADRLLRELHTFQVRTLDSWFVHLARLRGLELGLPPGWGPCEEGDAARQLAHVSGDLVREDPEDLLEVLRDLAFGQVKVGVLAAQDELFAHGLHLWHQSEPPAWERMRPDPAVPTADVGELLGDLEEVLERSELPRNKDGTTNGHWETNVEKIRRVLQDQDWDAFFEITLVDKVLTGEPKFSRHAIAPEWRDLVLRLAAVGRNVVRERIHRANVASERLLGRAAPELDALRRREGRLAFEDLPRLLGGSGAGPGVAARLDGRVAHLLLDEFQDTSLLQWRAVEPLATRVVEQGGAFLAVGDPKQSIYGWRGGEPRLLEELPQRLQQLTHHELEPKALATSWRSAPQILDYVNGLRERLDGFANDKRWPRGQRDGLRAMVSLLTEPHQAARKELEGGVRVRRAESHDDWKAVADAVEDVVRTRERVGGHGTVAVLVRDNKSIPPILMELRKRDVLASGEGGNPLVDSDAVNAALSLLWLADHPGDRTSWLHLAATPLARVLPGFPGERPETDETDRDDPAEAFATTIRRRLLAEGYGPFLTSLLRSDAFPEEGEDDPGEPGVRWDAWNRSRFVQLVELGHEWDRRVRLRPAEFVEFVQQRRVEDPHAASVRVMTVHQAKGLEFDAVVFVASQSSSSGNQGRDYTGLREDAFADYATVTLAPAKKQSVLDAAVLEDDATRKRWEELGLATLHETCHTALSEKTLEELCVVYVALTRAKHWLEVVVNPMSKKPSTFSRPVLFAPNLPKEGEEEPSAEEGAGEAADEPAEPAEPTRLMEGSCDLETALRSAAETARKASEEDSEPEPEPVPELRLAPAREVRVPRRVKPSSAIAEEEGLAFLEAGIGRVGAAARRRGNLLHALLEKVAWLEDGVPDEAELRAALAQQTPPPGEDEAAAALADFHAALEREAVRRALSRPEGMPAERLELERERRFRVLVSEGGEERQVDGAFDRVVVERDDAGQVVRVHVYDFKTGRLPDEAAVERARRHYAPQMALYRRAAARMWQVPEDTVTATLVFVDEGVALEPSP